MFAFFTKLSVPIFLACAGLTSAPSALVFEDNVLAIQNRTGLEDMPSLLAQTH
jgi:hypothetical protein